MIQKNNLSPAEVHEFAVEKLCRERLKPEYAEMLVLDSNNFIELYNQLKILNICNVVHDKLKTTISKDSESEEYKIKIIQNIFDKFIK